MAEILRKYTDPYEQLEFYARNVVEGFITGMHRSPYHGFSVEFAEHRLYNTGESTRHIDWKLFAKTDRLYVKRYEEETNLRCHLVVDCSPSMYFPVADTIDPENPNKIVFATYAAAALAHLFKKQRDAVGLTALADGIKTFMPAATTQSHHRRMVTELGQLLEQKPPFAPSQTQLVDRLNELAERLHKRSLVIIFSDMFEQSERGIDEVFKALQHFKYNKHEVILFHLSDGSLERDFEYPDRPTEFVDLETGESLKVNPRDIREGVVKAYSQFTHDLKVKCGQYKIDWIDADIRQGFDQILLPFLLKRSKLY
ncbi:MAG: DUF58 domain-containing protein [Schleiferiaceae bacterium]